MSFIKNLLNSIAQKISTVLQNKNNMQAPAMHESTPTKAINTQKKCLPANKTSAAKENVKTAMPTQSISTIAQEIATNIGKPHKKAAVTIRHKLTIHENPALLKMRRKRIEELARENDPDAQCKLGLMYFNGNGIEQNDDMAKYWLENASHQEFAMGQFNLAGMYYHGRGGAQNYETARDLFEKAAQQGLAEAQFHLSGMYAHGKGIEHDEGKARYWLEEAARQNHREAQLKLLNSHCYHV